MAVNEDTKVKDLSNQLRNSKHIMDGLMKDYVGLTVEELIRLKGGEQDEDSTRRRSDS